MSWGWMPNFRSFRIISRSEAVPRFRSVDSAMILLLRRLCQTLRIIVDTNASEKIIIGESCDVITKCEIMFHKYSKKSSNRVLKAIFSQTSPLVGEEFRGWEIDFSTSNTPNRTAAEAERRPSRKNVQNNRRFVRLIKSRCQTLFE